MGPYIDVSVQPAKKVSEEPGRLGKKGEKYTHDLESCFLVVFVFSDVPSGSDARDRVGGPVSLWEGASEQS